MATAERDAEAPSDRRDGRPARRGGRRGRRLAWLIGGGLLAAGVAALAPPAASQDDDDLAAGGIDGGIAADPPEGPPPGASPTARARWLGERIDALIAERAALAGARIGVAVRDLALGSPDADPAAGDGPPDPAMLYERDADGAYNLASNTKLVTASAALALLGPEFRYRTTLLATEIDAAGVVRGDLHVRGRGDPSFGRAQLIELVDHVTRAGITQIRGDIAIDDSYFDDQVTPPRFDEQPDEQAAFRAPVAAVSLSYCAFTVYVRPSRAGGGPAAVSVEPASTYIRVGDSAVITQRSGRNRVYIAARPRADHIELRVRGRVRAGSGVLRYRRRAPDPVQLFGAALRQALADRGVLVRGKRVRRAPVPDEAVRIAWVDSEPVSVLVDGLGKYSNNFMAEALLKTIGARTRARGRPATWEDGLGAVRDFLVDDVGLAPGSFRIDNGSGLFDASRMTPRQVVAVLAAAHRDMRWGPELVASLSIAGVDGTLRARMAGTAAERHVRAKTGTLARVSALGGYAAARADRPVAFAVFVNDLPQVRGAAADARGLQDDIASALIQYLRSAE